MFLPETINEISTTAQLFGLDARDLLTIALVESGGKVMVRIGDRYEPIIRFEGHYFDRRLKEEERLKARAQNLASPNPGQIRNPRKQEQRWDLLNRAAAINHQAAMESVSWGMGQVMGAHWLRLGFRNVEGLSNQARRGAGGQTALMARYIEREGLSEAIKENDWQKFARKYNGPNYRKNKYDEKLSTMHKRLKTFTHLPSGLMQKGCKNTAVACLQWMLANTGGRLKIDGIFGKQTEKHLLSFQEAHNIPASGIADAKTLYCLRNKGIPPHCEKVETLKIPDWMQHLHSDCKQ